MPYRVSFRARRKISSRRSAASPGRPRLGRLANRDPPAPDEIAIPAQQRLGADQEAGPAQPRQPLAETGEQEAIGRLPAGTLDLTLEDAQLVAQDQELKVEIGV
jgi:hypothetical protein